MSKELGTEKSIVYAKELDDKYVLSFLLEPIATWFKERYKSLTPPQKMAIPYIKQGHNVLISSPTGTGKTLAAFIPIIDDLIRYNLNGELGDYVYALYVSPLRALNNDMRKNLIAPITDINEYVRKWCNRDTSLRVGVRTSDTLPNEKARMLREPPHILITTPESLALILNAPKFREKLRNVRWVIIDEIHELAGNKRGSHLALSLERLIDLTDKEFQRIGLSATISPLEEVARFLTGFNNSGEPRPVVIVDARFTKPIDIDVLCPKMDLVYTPASVLNEAIYDILAKLVLENRTTLIFTNTRSATERVVYKLKKILSSNGVLDADSVEAHHSSLSREIRLEVEDKLKRGELKVAVSSTSLELGIDIGYIDLVALLSSPKSVTRLLQRVGRAGHNAYAVSRGAIVVVDRDDLIECTVLAKLARERKIDNVKIPLKPLDVLVQHVVGMSLEKPRSIQEILGIVKRAYPYRELTEEDLMSVINYLAGKYPGLEDYNVYAKIRFDEETKTVGRKRGARMIYQLNVGVIPDEAKIPVISYEENRKKYVGDLEEGFVEILSPGDIFVLGGKTYRILAIHPTHIYVLPAEGEKPTVPTWFSEMLPLSYDSALEVGMFRRNLAVLIDHLPREKVLEILVKEYGLEKHAAEYIYDYVHQQLQYMEMIPSNELIVIEVWRDLEMRSINIIFHALFGRRVNDVLSRVYAYMLSKKLGENVRITVTDNGFILTLKSLAISDSMLKDLINDIVEKITEDLVEKIARKAVRSTELFKKRFRHCAERAFMLLRRYKGIDVALARRQINAEKLIEVVEKYHKFPIIEETYREILEDFMDLTHAKEVIRKIHSKEIKIAYTFSHYAPSPFAHNIVAYGYSDVVLMEDKRKIIAKLQEIVKRYLEQKVVNK
ncbi:MAG: ATP-dependent helicase [Ignisphaera sp.]|uniref:ATP-dependent helicase n=1 Tax=Ignisphaera aggregans TaxID=334771 RepID=A0A7J3MXZ2_9CREN